jgi:excisionase family DNA binding protein
MDSDYELLSPAEAARRLSLGKTRFYQLLGSGAVASVRVGKLRRIPTRALRAYVDALIADQLGGEACDDGHAGQASSGDGPGVRARR